MTVKPSSGQSKILLLANAIADKITSLITVHNADSSAHSTILANYIQKSSTSGLVKNDGSIDTTSYLSSLPSHTHNTWTKTSLWTNGDNYAILWVNKDIRLCHLKYYQKNVSVSGSEKTLHTGLIPSSYRPSYTVMTGCYNPHVSVGAAKTGNIICVSDSSATRTVNCNLMWNY